MAQESNDHICLQHALVSTWLFQCCEVYSMVDVRVIAESVIAFSESQTVSMWSLENDSISLSLVVVFQAVSSRRYECVESVI